MPMAQICTVGSPGRSRVELFRGAAPEALIDSLAEARQGQERWSANQPMMDGLARYKAGN